MSPFLYDDAVQALQREFDASRLAMGGVNYWMAVRLLMLGRFSAEANRRSVELFGRPSHSAILFSETAGLRRDSRPLPPPVVVEWSALIFPPEGRSWGEATALFYELPVDYTASIGGEAVNKIADGFVEAFGPEVVKVCRFSPAVVRAKRRVDPAILHIAPWPVAFGDDEARRFRQAVRDVCSVLHALRPEFAITQADLLQNAAAIIRAARAHEVWLRGSGAKLLLTQSFPSFEKMAVLIGARRAGVRTADVQHGYMDARSIHNALPILPDGQRHIYPDAMWCWGEDTRRALANDASLVDAGVTPVLGGDVWGALRQSDTPAQADLLGRRLGADGYARRVLVGQQIETLSHSVTVRGYLPEIVHQAILQGPSDWLWMLRLHPRSLHLIEPITAFLRAEGLRNVEVELSSQAPIEAALTVADVYVTSFSVSAFEANALGRPVILFDAVGAELFAEPIRAGAFTSVYTAEDLVAAAATLGAPARLDYYRRDLALSRAAFDGLLTAAPLAMTSASAQAIS